ncbi:MAG: MBL fold metallo-hydrolase RNA specificity domain-containing protein [Armatimonadota bacterium]
MHGEPEAMASLADALRQRGWQVHLPRQGEEVTLPTA